MERYSHTTGRTLLRCEKGRVHVDTKQNLLGARDRPDPYDVWHLVGEQLRREEEGEVEDEKKQQKRWKKLVHIGCPLTSVGYKRRDTEGRALAKLELNDQ